MTAGRTARGLWLALVSLLGLIGLPAPAAAQKDQFIAALRPLYTAIGGVYGDEGPQLTAHVETLATTLTRWDQALARKERDLRAQLAAGNERAALEVHTVLASLYAERSRFRDALREIDAALRVDPRLPGLHRFKALLHSALNEPAAAADAFRAAWLLQPDEVQNAYDLIVHRSAQTTDADVNRALATLHNVERDLIRGTRRRMEAPFLTLNAIDEDASTGIAFAPAAYATAFAQLLAGDFETGIAALRAAAATDPLVADPATRTDAVARGLAALRQGNIAAAIERLTAAVAQTPASSEAHRMLATAYAVNGDIDESLRHLRDAVRLDRRNERAWLALGATLEEVGRTGEAVEALQRGIAELPDAGALRWLVSVLSVKRELTIESDVELIAMADRLVLLAGRAELYGRIASLAGAHFDYDAAVRLLEREAALTPNDHVTHRALGVAHVNFNRSAEAYAEYVVSLLLDPTDAATLTSLGLLHLAAGDYGRASEALTRALALRPSLAPAVQALGQALLRAGQVEEGQKRLEESAQLQAAQTANQRRMRSAASLRMQADRDMADGNYARAIANWQEVIPVEPNRWDNHILLAEALVAEKRLEEAATHLQTAISLEAGAEARRRLADVYAALGRTADAQRARQTYVESRLHDLRARAGEAAPAKP